MAHPTVATMIDTLLSADTRYLKRLLVLITCSSFQDLEHVAELLWGGRYEARRRRT